MAAISLFGIFAFERKLQLITEGRTNSSWLVDTRCTEINGFLIKIIKEYQRYKILLFG